MSTPTTTSTTTTRELPTPYQQFIHKSRYARYVPEKGRRETWAETVERYIDYFRDDIKEEELIAELRSAIAATDVMPSMRAMMTAGAALKRDNMCGFNCSYTTIEHPKRFR